jgi:hypothetical protein
MLYTAENTDDAKRAEYMWRGEVKEVNMRVLADGTNIMHGNVSTHYRDDVDKATFNTVENKDYISFPVSKEVLGANTSVGSILENEPSRPLPVERGHSQLYDIGLGYIEESVSEVKVKLHALHVNLDGISTLNFSHEPNVKMDTISFILELQ